MNSIAVRCLSSLVPLALVAGCSAAPGAEESPESASSAIVSRVGGGIVVQNPPVVDMTSVCSTATPVATFPLPILPQEVTVTEQGNPADACSYGVIEVTGTQGHTFGMMATDFHGTTWGAGGLTQAQCAASYFGYDVFGWVPPKIVSGGIGPNGLPILKTVPGYWEPFTVADGSSAPAWASGHCMYSFSLVASLPLPYTKIRIATEALIDDATGWHTIPLYVTVHD